MSPWLKKQPHMINCISHKAIWENQDFLQHWTEGDTDFPFTTIAFFLLAKCPVGIIAGNKCHPLLQLFLLNFGFLLTHNQASHGQWKRYCMSVADTCPSVCLPSELGTPNICSHYFQVIYARRQTMAQYQFPQGHLGLDTLSMRRRNSPIKITKDGSNDEKLP